jgi:hypothetical protein
MLQLIADTFPKGSKKIGIKMGGGADSALVAFALAKYSRLAKLSCRLIPIIIEVDEFKYQVPVVEGLIQKIQQHTGVNFLNSIIYSVPNGNKLIEKMRDIEKELFESNQVDLIASGAIHYPKSKEFNPPEGQGPIENRVGSFQVLWDGPIYTPFVNLDKREIAKFYEANDLISDFFPLTRTCNRIKSTEVAHCGICWSCLERLYGFGQI